MVVKEAFFEIMNISWAIIVSSPPTDTVASAGFRLLLALLDPAGTFKIFTKAVKEAGSGTKEHWSRIKKPTHHGFLCIFSYPDLKKEPNGRPALSGGYCETVAQLDSVFRAAPPQQDGSTRVYLSETHTDHLRKQECARASYFGVSGSDHDFTSRYPFKGRYLFSEDSDVETNGFASLISSRPAQDSRWCRLESFDFLFPSREGSLRHQLDLGFARIEQSVLFQDIGQKSTALIQCRTFVRESLTLADESPPPLKLKDFPNPEKPLLHPPKHFRHFSLKKAVINLLPQCSFSATSKFAFRLNEVMDTYGSVRNALGRRRSFALHYYHANLILYAEFVNAYEEAYVERKQPQLDPRSSDFKQGHLKEITKHSCQVQDIGRAGSRMMEAIEHLLDMAQDILETSHSSFAGSSTSVTLENDQFIEMEHEIRVLCVEVKGSLARLSSSLEHDLKFLGLHREMKQTASVQQLTILATIFLPLSLSAGVLSMQTRFKDLGTLLYDFVGVVVLLAALVLPFILFLDLLKIATDDVLVNFGLHMTEGEDMTRDKSNKRRFERLRKGFLPCLWFGLTLFGILVLVSFVIGMFQNVDLGARVLGYGVAVFSFPFVLLALFFWSILFLSWLLKKGRSQRRGETGQQRTAEEGAQASVSAKDATALPKLAENFANVQWSPQLA